MSRTVNIALFGTSLTTGHLNRGWPNFLQTELQRGKRSFVRVHPRGKPSATSDYLLSQVDQVARLRDDIVLAEALNDGGVQVQIDGMTPAKAEANWNTIIDTLRAYNPSVKIYLMTLIRNSAAGDASNPMVRVYDAQRQTIAAAKGTGWIDCYPPWGDPALHPEEYTDPDGHPSLSAYLRVCVPTISAVLRPLYD